MNGWKTFFDENIYKQINKIMNQIFSETFKQYNLLQHPFYLAWNKGTLIRDQLALYAGEYGAFIKLISTGWETIGEREIAAEETGHYELWQKFAGSIGSTQFSANLPSVRHLINTTVLNYKNYAGTLGSLYAFEAQQPATASSKLKGLRKQYSHWNIDETYFKVHENDLLEPAMLEEKMERLNPGEKAIAASACSSTCQALWDALSGIMEAR
jgi:pyrroloquinoline-quinone synthase